MKPLSAARRIEGALAAATQSVDATAQATGADPQTARHYLDAAKAFDRTEILKRASGLLLWRRANSW